MKSEGLQCRAFRRSAFEFAEDNSAVLYVRIPWLVFRGMQGTHYPT